MPRSASRRSLLLPSAVLLGIVAVMATAGVFGPGSREANAQSSPVTQCNQDLASNVGGMGLECSISIVNYLDGTGAAEAPSSISMTRCEGEAGPIATHSGTCVTTATTSPSAVTLIQQCNESANGGGGVLYCSVSIVNHYSTMPVGGIPDATLFQCDGSTISPPTAKDCSPANTPGLTPDSEVNVSQCNGSGTGGTSVGFTCAMAPGSSVVSTLPVRISQCNGSATGGGALTICTVSITSQVAPDETPTSSTSTTVTETATPITPGITTTTTPVTETATPITPVITTTTTPVTETATPITPVLTTTSTPVTQTATPVTPVLTTTSTPVTQTATPVTPVLTTTSTPVTQTATPITPVITTTVIPTVTVEVGLTVTATVKVTQSPTVQVTSTQSGATTTATPMSQTATPVSSSTASPTGSASTSTPGAPATGTTAASATATRTATATGTVFAPGTATATFTGTATSGVSTATPVRTAPAPPNTGTSGSSGGAGNSPIALLGALLLTASAALVFETRRRNRQQ